MNKNLYTGVKLSVIVLFVVPLFVLPFNASALRWQNSPWLTAPLPDISSLSPTSATD